MGVLDRTHLLQCYNHSSEGVTHNTLLGCEINWMVVTPYLVLYFTPFEFDTPKVVPRTPLWCDIRWITPFHDAHPIGCYERLTRNDIYIFTGVFNWNMWLVDFVYACALGIQKDETYTKIQSPKINANEGSCKMSNMKRKKRNPY